MGTLQRSAAIGAGFVGALALAALAVRVRYLGVDPAVAEASSGMYAAGDAILFVLVAGAFGLVPAFFLLRGALASRPRAVALGMLCLSVTGPLSWWTFVYGAMGVRAASPTLDALFAMALLFVVGPRVIASPVVLFALLGARWLVREPLAHRRLSAAAVIEGIPLVLLALHFTRACVTH